MDSRSLSVGRALSASSEILALDAGQIVLSDESLPLKLANAVPDSMTVTIVGKRGDVFFRRTYDATALGQALLTRIEWAAIEGRPGFSPFLRLQAELSLNQKPYKKFEIPFFLLDKMPVLSVSTVPPEAEPDATVLSEASYSAPSSSWLVWKLNGRILALGSDASSLKTFWKTGTQNGVAELSTELYPDQPLDGKNFDFPSSIRIATRMAVTDKPQPLPGELTPETSYRNLWHFRGTLRNIATGTVLSQTSGPEVRWGLTHGAYAVLFPEKTTLEAPGDFLPENPQNPFTINLTLLPTSRQGPISLIESKDPEGNLQAEVLLLSGAVPAVKLFSGGSPLVESRAPFALPDEFSNVSLTSTMDEDGLHLFWFLNGRMKGFESFPAVKALPPRRTGGKIVWHGPVVWSEVGVYARNERGEASPDQDIYRRAVVSKFGSDLLLAEGFAGLELPVRWSAPRTKTPLLAVVLQPQEKLTSPLLSVSPGLWAFQFSVRNGGPWEGTLNIRDESGDLLWTSALKNDETPKNWDRRGMVEVRCRLEWVNQGNTKVELNELAVFRKKE